VEIDSSRLAQLRRALTLVRIRQSPRTVLAEAKALDQTIVLAGDEAWPSDRFEGLTEAPVALFVRGSLPRSETPAVGVVGTREATPYGLRLAREMAEDLAGRGVWIVCGLALGVDGAAHEGALAAGGRTLAVTGAGLDIAYPLRHVDLKERIAAGGAVISEHPPGVEPRRWHFPRRNRLVAALSDVVVVVEAPARSGALITARLALDLGREVLAVPGNVTRATHAGCHRLLKQGAAGLCEGTADVLLALGEGVRGQDGPGGASRRAPAPPAGGVEATLWRMLDADEAQDANVLCLRSGLDAASVAAALAALEIDGRALRVPGLGFVRT